MDIKKVVVAGGGVLGSQIAYQSAFCGFDVTVWLRSEGSIERAKPKFERLLKIYLGSLEQMKTDKSAYCRGFSKTPDLSDEEIDALKEQAQKAFDSLAGPLRSLVSIGFGLYIAYITLIAVATPATQKISQYLTLPEVSLLNSLIIVGTIPKDHSPVSAFCSEYNSPCVIAFGFIILVLVFPPPAGPTIINPCRTCNVSYNWIILSLNACEGIKLYFLSAQTVSTFLSKSS